MKHIFKKTMLTCYLSLSTLFMFLIMFIPVETNVNVTDIITISANSSKAPTTDGETTSSLLSQRTVTIITYSIISLMFGIPILTFLTCIYHMKGTAPCDFKAACCNCISC